MKNICLFSALLISFALPAQEFTSSRVRESATKIAPLRRLGNNYYSLNFEWQGMSGFSANLKRFIHSISLQKYDAELNKLKNVPVAGGERLFGPVEPELLIINNAPMVFYFKSSGKGNQKLYCSRVDTATLAIADEKELLTIDADEDRLKFYMRSFSLGDKNRTIIRDYFFMDGNATTKTFFVEPSPDGSRYVIMWNTGWERKLFFSVVDKQFNRIRESVAELKDESELRVKEVITDNTGNVFIAYTSEGKKVVNAGVYSSAADGKATKTVVEIPGGSPANMLAAINNKGDKLFLTGTYSEGTKFLTGIFALTMETASLKTGNVVKTPFSKELISQCEEEGWAAHKTKYNGLSDNLFLYLFNCGNDEYHLVGEFKGTVEFQRSSLFVTGSMLHCSFNNLNGTVSRIPKFMAEHFYTYGPSINLMKYKNDIILFYNDNVNNINRDIKDKPYSPKIDDRTIFAAAIIGANGSVTRKLITNDGARRFLADSEQMIALDRNSFLVPYHRNEMRGLGKVEEGFKWELLKID